MNSEWERVAPISFILPRENSSELARRLRQEYLGDRELANNKPSANGLGKLYGDSITAVPVYRMATMMSRHSAQTVYYYIGNHSFYEDAEFKKPTGVARHDDLLYLFTLSFRFPAIEVSDSSDSPLVDTMTGFWHNFATYGDPNDCGPTKKDCLGILWAVTTPTKRAYLRINNELSIHENLFEHRFRIWYELYPIEY